MMVTLVWTLCLVMRVDPCSRRMGALIGLDLAKLIMQILACLVAIMGGAEAICPNGLAPVYLGGFHPIYSPGMDALLDLDLGLARDLGLADDPSTFTEWEVKEIKNGVA